MENKITVCVADADQAYRTELCDFLKKQGDICLIGDTADGREALAMVEAQHPAVLVLDDSSSALDYRTDARLRQALREQYKDTTTIIIAQRISSIKHCDHILVLDDGKEIGYGTHQELLESCEVYRQISQSQMGGVDIAART